MMGPFIPSCLTGVSKKGRLQYPAAARRAAVVVVHPVAGHQAAAVAAHRVVVHPAGVHRVYSVCPAQLYPAEGYP